MGALRSWRDKVGSLLEASLPCWHQALLFVDYPAKNQEPLMESHGTKGEKQNTSCLDLKDEELLVLISQIK